MEVQVFTDYSVRGSLLWRNKQLTREAVRKYKFRSWKSLVALASMGFDFVAFYMNISNEKVSDNNLTGVCYLPPCAFKSIWISLSLCQALINHYLFHWKLKYYFQIKLSEVCPLMVPLTDCRTQISCVQFVIVDMLWLHGLLWFAAYPFLRVCQLSDGSRGIWWYFFLQWPLSG